MGASGKNHRSSLVFWTKLMLGILVFFGFFCLSVSAQNTKPTFDLDRLAFLSGEWIGEGGGDPGQGIGGFTFNPDLQGKVIVRKNYAEYPATKDKPAFRHDDLMIIYKQPGDTMRAIYWDNEGHVINYTVEVSPDSKSAVFVSLPSASTPGFRLTYKMKDEKNIGITFEIAPPGRPDKFSPYLEASAHRK